MNQNERGPIVSNIWILRFVYITERFKDAESALGHWVPKVEDWVYLDGVLSCAIPAAVWLGRLKTVRARSKSRNGVSRNDTKRQVDARKAMTETCSGA